MTRLSIVIPAHNEATVIGRLLRPLREQAIRQGVQLRVVVVANACTDDTASIARHAWPEAIVIETPVAGKTHALNLGDDAAGDVWPRCYVDADVQIDLEALLKVASSLQVGQVLAAAPMARWSLDHCSFAVRQFYRVDAAMPSHREGIGGSGVYVASREGRARFGRWPTVVGDDAFFRRQFRETERRTIASARSIVSPPATLGELVRIKTRSHLGHLELDAMLPDTVHSASGNRRALLRLAGRPTWWAALAIYGVTKAIARWRSRRQFAAIDRYVWERDATSRMVIAPAGKVAKAA